MKKRGDSIGKVQGICFYGSLRLRTVMVEHSMR